MTIPDIHSAPLAASRARPNHRVLFLIAAIPTFTLEMLNQFWLEPAYRLGIGWFYLFDLLQWIAVPVLVWYLVLHPHGVMLKDFGLNFSPYRKKLPETFGLFVFVALMLWLADFPVEKFVYPFFQEYTGSFGYGDVIPHAQPWHSMVVLYFAASAGLIEEVVFRGLTWAYLSRVLHGPTLNFWYIMLSSVLFAAVHSEQGVPGVIAAFSYGLMASYLYARLKNLWPLVAGHFIADLINYW